MVTLTEIDLDYDGGGASPLLASTTKPTQRRCSDHRAHGTLWCVRDGWGRCGGGWSGDDDDVCAPRSGWDVLRSTRCVVVRRKYGGDRRVGCAWRREAVVSSSGARC